MTFFINPEPEDIVLFWFYLTVAVFLAIGGWFLYTTPPVPDACGHVGYNKASAYVVWVSVVIVLAFAENRRSGWFFWTR